MLSYRQAFSHCPHFFSNRLSLPLYHLSIYLSMLCYRQGFSHSAHFFSNRLSLPFSSRPVCCLSEIIFSGQMALGRMSAPSWREMKEAARGPTAQGIYTHVGSSTATSAQISHTFEQCIGSLKPTEEI